MVVMRRSLRWQLVGAGAVVLVGAGLITAGAHSGGEVRTPISGLTVVVSDAMAGPKADCSAIDYSDTFFAAASVQLRDEDGKVLATAPLRGAPRPSNLGCDWSVTFADVPGASSYGIELRGDTVPPRVHDYTVSRQELSDHDWRVRIGVIR
ncbi:hypothetical protein GB882_03470 [Georgenia ruanii]|uniref:Uncharacterized protein n=2 Tax=Georgenia ruanii TaxID=348442 RepID=A0A7J9UT81_9MICO|nr:hypothetical protein [Georgenia ruanii]